MGCYTTVVFQNNEYRFNGGDCMQCFNVGDKVPWYLSHVPGQGHLFDGTYDAYGPDDSDYIVVIKNHIIRGVFKADEINGHEEFRLLYEISQPDRSWWTERAWEIQAELDKISSDRIREAKQGSTAKLRVLSIPIYDIEPTPRQIELWHELHSLPIPGRNTEQ